MVNAQNSLIVSFVLNVLLFTLFLLSLTWLIDERSGDKLRLTVHRDDLLTSVQSIQGACRCLVSAAPIGADEDVAEYWILSFAQQPTELV